MVEILVLDSQMKNRCTSIYKIKQTNQFDFLMDSNQYFIRITDHSQLQHLYFFDIQLNLFN